MTVKIERHLKDMTIEERRALMPARLRRGLKTGEQSRRSQRVQALASLRGRESLP
jgi:hypothetical protein